MIHLCLPDLRRTRARLFFWLGLLILPIFWIWWMHKRSFSRTERLIGWTWTSAYTATAAFFHQELAEYITSYLSIGHPVVAMWITIGLGVWLMGRNRAFSATLFEIFFLFLVLGASLMRAMHDILMSSVQMGSPFHIWILPIIPAIIHLLITPDWGGLRRPAPSSDACDDD
jgi:hypothetical protein